MPEEPDEQLAVTLSYARTHLHALIREVQAGKLVHIRRRDGLSAALVPDEPDSEKPPR